MPTLADEISDLMDAVGYDMGPDERTVNHALYPVDKRGLWVGLESAVIGPRQNVKTANMIGGALHDTFVQGVEVSWTAHEFKTSSDAFRDFQAIIEGNDWLASEVLAVRTANGKEGFDLRNGARLDIMARTGKSGRGMARRRLYVDEALFVDGKMMGALVPTMSAMPNAHMVYGSSPGLPTSAVLRGLRRRGRSGVDPHLGYAEYSNERQPCADDTCAHLPGTPGCWLDDLEAVLRVNLAAGRRISIDFIMQERLTLASAPDEYLRERMGVWEDPPNEGGVTVYPLDEWTASTDPMSRIADGGPISWSVDVSWNRATAFVAAVGARPDGLLHVQVVHTCDPTKVADYLGERVRMFDSHSVSLQGTGAPASSLIDEITKAVGDACEVIPMTATDMSKACGMTHDAIKTGRVRHIGDPSLSRSLLLAQSRSIGDGWVLDRKGSPTDIANLVAVTNALWMASTHEAEVIPTPFVIF